MRETWGPRRAVVSVCLAAALLAYVGCSSDRKPGPVTNLGAVQGPDNIADAEPRTPDAVLVVSGQQIGYLEPCGCTEGQSGGLGRRADLMAGLRAQGTPIVPIDLGSLIDDPDTARGGPDQTLITLGISLEALEQLDYRALALAARDLDVGIGEFVGQYMVVPEAPPLIATNLRAASGYDAIFRPSTRVEAGPITVGILAVADPESIEALEDPEQAIFLDEINDPAEAVRAALPDLEAETDVQVLMVQGSSDLARSLAEQFPSLEVVVGASPYDYAPTEPETVVEGGPLLVLVGKKGQQVVLVDLFEDEPRRPGYHRIVLDTEFESVEPIDSLIGKEFPTRLLQNAVLENYPRRPHPSGASYVGAETCKTCHPKTFEKWSLTPHAAAWQALVHGPRGDRTMDASCVSCHATGLGDLSGFVTASQTPHLKGQQCENCHGPGSRHVAAPTDAAILESIRVTEQEAEQSLCITCHDGDNDPHWDFAKRWPMVVHNGLDTYDDPKVRRGLDPETFARPDSAPVGD